MSNAFITPQRARKLKLRVLRSILMDVWERKSVIRCAFSRWQRLVCGASAANLNDAEREVIRILRYTKPGCRSDHDKSLIELFYRERITMLPAEITPSEMDQLCDRTELYPVIGRSILFLQGDFGNVFYIVAQGHVNLFYEQSKDREIVLAGQFEKMRAAPYTGTDEGLEILGNMIFSPQVILSIKLLRVLICR